MTLKKGTSVLAADGNEIGKVSEVVGDEQQGIFSGITVSPGLLSENRFVPATLVGDITEEQVSLAISSDELESRTEPPP
jgi:sporulation protein YlmC with PRC-barrel domain